MILKTRWSWKPFKHGDKSSSGLWSGRECWEIETAFAKIYQPLLQMRRLALRIHEYLTFFGYDKKIDFCRSMKSFITLLVSREFHFDWIWSSNFEPKKIYLSQNIQLSILIEIERSTLSDNIMMLYPDTFDDLKIQTTNNSSGSKWTVMLSYTALLSTWMRTHKWVFLLSVISNSDEQYIERSTTFPQVSWIRRRDWHIMSVGETVFTTDDRVQVLFQLGSTRVHDEKIYSKDSFGWYVC